MNAEQFVKAIDVVVRQSAANGTIDLLTSPPGRRPSSNAIRLSKWFHSLKPADKENVVEVANLAADQSAYNFLLVLDGLLTLEPVGTKGKFEIFYNNGETRTQLNDQQLSGLFKEV